MHPLHPGHPYNNGHPVFHGHQPRNGLGSQDSVKISPLWILVGIGLFVALTAR